jgi:hypothetical protein
LFDLSSLNKRKASQPADDWTTAIEQLAGNLQAVTDKRVVEDMDDDERQAYESLLSAYGDRRRRGR